MSSEFGKPSSPKRAKLNSSNDIFYSLHKQHAFTLKLVLDLMKNGLSGYAAGIAKINVCNAQCSRSFSKATCDCSQISCPGDGAEPRGYLLSSIFQYGIEMLEAFVESSQRIPDRKGARIALQKLLTFLSDHKGAAEKALASEVATETEWTSRMVHHLLSKLAVCTNYRLDSQCKRKIRELICDCGCREKMSGHYGDTSLGVPFYWHGRVDILMDVAVTTIPTDIQDSPEAGSETSIKSKSAPYRMAARSEKIRAETIVYSFLQKKNHPDFENFLVPTIAMSKTHVAICAYDSENDIFLETPCLDLFNGQLLKEATIVTLWLALNYRHFCSGVPEDILTSDYKADFFKNIGPLLEKYTTDVECPCDYQTTYTWPTLALGVSVNQRVKNINQIP